MLMSLFFCRDLHSDRTTECGVTQCCTGKAISKNTFLPRAFSSSSSREIIMRKPMYDDPIRDDWNGILTTAVEFSQNFGCNSDKNLGTMPFWSGSNVMTVGTNDGQSDLDAWQFGMGNVASVGSIKLNPRVQQAGADLMLHFMQHLNSPGFYFKIKAPIGAMMIDPKMSMPVVVPSSSATGLWSMYPAPDNRPATIAAAFAGGEATCKAFDGSFSNNVRLEYGKVSVCKSTVFRFADVSFSLGANVVKSEKAILGIGFKASAPTGNVAQAVEMLEPIFGHGGYWGVGGEVFGYYKLYENDEDFILNLHWQGEVSHLAPGRTSYRSFDLKQNGLGSKYLLLEYYHQNAAGAYVPGGFITQAINITTLPVISKFSVEGSLALMIDGQCRNWDLGLGGEVWGRSCEQLSINTCKAIKNINAVNFNDFVVLGRQRSGLTTGGAIRNLSEPLAFINKSQDQLTSGISAETATIKDATLSVNRIPINIDDALDVAGAAASRALTGKVFANLGYGWKEHNYQPHVSVFGSAEFTGSNNNALNMWAVGLQGSLNF
jgi:hypothetical protein